MKREKIIEKLRDDDHYYGEFGRNYLSNSYIKILYENPLDLYKPMVENSNLLVGKYFHTCILEPNKKSNFKVIDSSTRNTSKYKAESEGEMCLLEKEVENINIMQRKLKENDFCNFLLNGSNVEYEVPNIIELFGNMWKGKADIVNNDEKLVVDLKTTSNINKFRSSAFKYNYDSQSYIYKSMFGYDFVFIVIDKNTHQIGVFDCSDAFYESGEQKVQKASELYDMFYKSEDFDRKQYYIKETL
tara:strand:+ start:285 stop:1016 length:732 start_codon:yes stop_codon:yes gene_type:complete